MKHCTVYLESLGCPKNRVDSEVMLAALLADGWYVTDDSTKADLIILNSCAFIEEAREETIARFFALHAQKRKGARVVLAGCLPQLHPDMGKLLPEADFVIGIDDVPRIAAIAEGAAARPIKRPKFIATSRYEREFSLSPFTAYVKIADGCDNHCAYCTIPAIRGAYRERTPHDVVEEARRFVERGVKEIVLIAQDTSAYGRNHNTSLAALLRRLDRLAGEFRIRVMYLYPSRIDDELLDAFTASKVLPYFEIPLQHVSDRILSTMRRRYRRRDIERMLDRIAARFGDRAVLRTTFIAGFPGETRAEHAELRRFIEEAPFDYIGLFGYSREERTPAAALSPLRRDTVARRLDALRAAAQETMERRLSRFIGTTTIVLYEEFDAAACLPIGRGIHQAPEIDGITILTDLENERPGDLLTVRLTGRDGIDFTAVVKRTTRGSLPSH